jgi:hypothetical protein
VLFPSDFEAKNCWSRELHHPHSRRVEIRICAIDIHLPGNGAELRFPPVAAEGRGYNRTFQPLGLNGFLMRSKVTPSDFPSN